MGSIDSAVIERYEERGFFLTIPFQDEDSPTLLYVADQDFETLKELIENPDTEWTEVRDELKELLDHSGHPEEHTFDRELVEQLIDVLHQQSPPESTSIDDPFEDINSSTDSSKK